MTMPVSKSDRIKIPFQGLSMWPVIEAGQSLIVEIHKAPKVLETKDVGRVFVFKDSAEWICHRYLGVHNDKHIFKGDYSTTHELIESPLVLGVVLGFENRNKQSYFFKESKFSSFIFLLQKRSILKSGWLKKGYRYSALLLTMGYKPFLYRKVQPADVIE